MQEKKGIEDTSNSSGWEEERLGPPSKSHWKRWGRRGRENGAFRPIYVSHGQWVPPSSVSHHPSLVLSFSCLSIRDRLQIVGIARNWSVERERSSQANHHLYLCVYLTQEIALKWHQTVFLARGGGCIWCSSSWWEEFIVAAFSLFKYFFRVRIFWLMIF